MKGMLRLAEAIAVAAILAVALPTQAAHARSTAALSATSGIPGEQVTLTVTDAGALAGLWPLAVHLRALPLAGLGDWPCDSPGSRFLGLLEADGSDAATLTFSVPWVQPGAYRLMGVAADRSCVSLADQPLEFSVSPDVPIHLPLPEIVRVRARYGPAVPGCGTWDINGSQGADDCGPYEYMPLDTEPIHLIPGAPVILGISQNWRYGRWDLAAIPEETIVRGLEWPDEVTIARGAGGTRTITARLPATASGVWRLFLRFHATRGRHSVDMDRPSVFRIRLALPDTATGIVTARAPAVATSFAASVMLGVGLVTFVVIAARRRPSRR